MAKAAAMWPTKMRLFFKELGAKLGDIFVERLTQDKEFEIPVMLNAGNPADLMTNIIGDGLRHALNTAARSAREAGDKELAHRLTDARKSLGHKVMGLGGVLDGARAVTAIHEMTDISLADIIDVPVLGTHNERMVVDVDHSTARTPEGDIVPLREYPGVEIDEVEANKRTRMGGTRIIKNYKDLLDMDQSAVLATGAALMKITRSRHHQQQSAHAGHPVSSDRRSGQA